MHQITQEGIWCSLEDGEELGQTFVSSFHLPVTAPVSFQPAPGPLEFALFALTF